jgi:hypothetical protein
LSVNNTYHCLTLTYSFSISDNLIKNYFNVLLSTSLLSDVSLFYFQTFPVKAGLGPGFLDCESGNLNSRANSAIKLSSDLVIMSRLLKCPGPEGSFGKATDHFGDL